MAEFRVEPVDPRDQRWEVWNPPYRVRFWRSSGSSSASREIEVSGGDVELVLDWAEGEAAGEESFAVFVAVERTDGLGLIRLRGDDPTRRGGE
jgi:hypothetical protein